MVPRLWATWVTPLAFCRILHAHTRLDARERGQGRVDILLRRGRFLNGRTLLHFLTSSNLGMLPLATTIRIDS